MSTDANPNQQSGQRPALHGLDPQALLASGLANAKNSSPPVIPGYQIFSLLGRGGMGAVYEAHQESLDRRVAIKVLSPDAGFNEQLLQRLEKEARTMARLKHPGIVPVYDFIRLEEGAAIIMERIDGYNLRQLLAQNPQGLPVDQARALALQIASALQAAHAAGIIHRDIKPENVLVTAKDETRLSDFGVAFEKTANETRLTSEGATVGTLGYMAPEQLAGAELDARADLYSFGLLLHEMLTGRRPLEIPPDFSQHQNIPASLRQLIIGCLQGNPAKRISSADELVTGLQASENNKPGISRRNLILGLSGIAAATAATLYFNKSKLIETGWTNLLDNVNPSTVLHRGEWHKTATYVESTDSTEGALLAVPAKQLGSSYDLDFSFTRMAGSKSVALFFRTVQGVGSLEFDAWEQPGLSGVQMLDETDLRTGNSFQFPLQNGTTYSFRLEVRPDSIQVYQGDKLLHRYAMTGHKLQVSVPWNWTDDWAKTPLALGTWESPTRFHHLRFRQA